ncbi:hypothetical protein AVEN_194304-1 [Araneus ventricosus]|uniref:Zinc finger PHD-type domain-containing protein n=1 Tax=Araneus ventricosus TaxID=182803 RepID=A0A4Y2SFF3_ARAVE|nr:hypothetical protein AVEN_90838-1 [Araneus ventricosus]GBN86827.1 hypothetical protein AVEN_194304-1 [Araneus ventricosus]
MIPCHAGASQREKKTGKLSNVGSKEQNLRIRIICIVCEETEEEEEAIQCIKCHTWVYALCADVNLRIKKYFCSNRSEKIGGPNEATGFLDWIDDTSF